MPDANFYLGRWADDPAQAVQYDPADLTTHAVMIGMTGSGKTGLLIAVLEEAARQGLPAIIIDPKGDLTNLLLHFPELRGRDFAPWIDPEAARRAGVALDSLAADTAERWRNGLAEWKLGRAEIEALRDAVDYAVYTPGSTAGTPVNLLSSFEAPGNWQGDDATALKEAYRERISATVTALLGLVGVSDVDPLRSREHILLSNIIEYAWSRDQSLNLAGLIEQVTAPPFDRLGAFPLERFFPEKDRFALALLLNNFLAAPSFQTWLEGQPLDVPTLLRTPAGRPRFSIFYLAHLSESERMFFVTLLLAAVESWMRAQRGTSGLRALLAFDEIVGYLPPVANPPSRAVLLRLLKQARAFGLGLMLSTQNPTDLNYKALSNAGTWFIGRLQTEQDKDRLLDGLQSLETGIDRAAFDRLIAGLKPRLFLLHNVHRGGPRTFQSRWALNYLAGPLTRVQIADLPGYKPEQGIPKAGPAALKAEPGAPPPRVYGATYAVPQAAVPQATPAPARQRPKAADPGYATAPPALPASVSQFFYPTSVSLQRALSAQGGALRGPLEPRGLVYRPALLAQAEVRYLNRRYNLEATREPACLVFNPDLTPDWDEFTRRPFNPEGLRPAPAPDSRFDRLPATLASARHLSAMQKDFLDWAYRNSVVYVRACEPLKVYAGPQVAEETFRRSVDAAARTAMQAEIDKVAAAFDARLEALARKIERQQLSVDRREDALGQRRSEQTAADLEFISGLLGGRKRPVSNSVSKRRMTQQAKGQLDEARKLLKDMREEWKQLADEREAELARVQLEWQERAAQVTSIPVTPAKKDIFIELFGVAWMPYYLIDSPDGTLELAAF